MISRISLDDAIAIAPAWIYNLQGDKIGTRARPWRLSDYVVALGLARNPIAVRSRITTSKIQSTSTSRKRKAEDNAVQASKRCKAERAIPESSKVASADYKSEPEEKIVLKAELLG